MHRMCRMHSSDRDVSAADTPGRLGLLVGNRTDTRPELALLD
jgi:hypothetical protein